MLFLLSWRQFENELRSLFFITKMTVGIVWRFHFAFFKGNILIHFANRLQQKYVPIHLSSSQTLNLKAIRIGLVSGNYMFLVKVLKAQRTMIKMVKIVPVFCGIIKLRYRYVVEPSTFGVKCRRWAPSRIFLWIRSSV